LYSRPAFNAEVAALAAGIGSLTDAEIGLRLMRLVAGGKVAHTAIGFNSPLFGRYPLLLSWYSDGLFVWAATADLKDVTGARVLRIGNLTPEQAEAAVAPYIARENEVWLRASSPFFIGLPELMKLLHIAGPGGELQLTLSKAGGPPYTVTVNPAPNGDPPRFSRGRIPPTLSTRKNDPFYWFEYVPESKLLYIQYNQCFNDPKRPFKQFVRELLQSVSASPIDRVIVDLRSNPGGDSTITSPLISGLKSRPELSSRGRLHVLTSRRTASSGGRAALEMRQQLGAILVGEPTAFKPNCYGEVRPFTLPNSRIAVSYSTRYYDKVAGDPPSLEPDVPIEGSYDDYLHGRDVVLDAALRHPPG
jgi:hypothetical protein